MLLLHKISQVVIHSHKGDADFIYIVTGILQRNKLTLVWCLICPDYVLRTSEDILRESDLTLKKKKEKARSRRYPAETVMDTDYADDLAFFYKYTGRNCCKAWNRQHEA